MFDGFYAKEIGLVTQVSADPEADAQELIDQILSRSPDLVAATKTLFDKTWSMAPRRAFGLNGDCSYGSCAEPTSRSHARPG